MHILAILFIGLFVGLLIIGLVDFIEKRYACKKAKTEGKHIIEKAKESSDTLLEEAQYAAQKASNKVLQAFEKTREKYKNSIRNIQSEVDKKSHKLKLKSQEVSKKAQDIQSVLSNVKSQLQSVNDQSEKIKSELNAKKQNIIDKIQERFSIDSEEIKKQLNKILKESWLEEKTTEVEKQETYQIQLAEKNAVNKINLVLNRFERAYCPRRTIEPVEFKSGKLFDKVAGKNQANIQTIEKECGVDLVASKEDLIVKIFGIDPVRRELGRITIKTLLKKRHINEKTVKDTVKKCKKDLFETIRKDGKNIAKNLKLKNITTEVLDMMGSLKYRYSFAQNQYYHCEEVGWLCGLMSSEFELPNTKGRRSGMFHDIGKAMDHSIEGSHAVIGAEFLAKNNEAEDVIHAVRAHHHDETPSTPLAYLVIAADAISGSRPGARHFTEDSYTKKMASLGKIIESFENIEDGYIMSAGREMRIIVDSAKVSDEDALVLSKQVARKIEKECSYPGLIKVTVVRHSEAVSVAN